MDNNNNNDFLPNTVYRRSPKRKNRALIVVLYFLVVAILAISAFFISNAILRSRNQQPTPSADTTDTQSTDTTEAPEPKKNPTDYPCTTVDVASADFHVGNLILVNADFPYVFPAEEKLVAVYGNRPDSRPYKLSTINHKLTDEVLEAFNKMMTDFAEKTGNHCVQITAAYRSFEDQQQLYDDRVNSVGAVEAAKYVALPGNSEHHLGSALDMNVYSDDGKSYTLDKYDQTMDVFFADCHKYGFILRYPSNKVSITGISYEPWHFRYIGVPHAYAIYSANYCLEEYIAELRNHTFEGEHFKIEDDTGAKYDVYYVPASAEETTKLPVPETLPYTVSGNNVDGFIVTVSLAN